MYDAAAGRMSGQSIRCTVLADGPQSLDVRHRRRPGTRGVTESNRYLRDCAVNVFPPPFGRCPAARGHFFCVNFTAPPADGLPKKGREFTRV